MYLRKTKLSKSIRLDHKHTDRNTDTSKVMKCNLLKTILKILLGSNTSQSLD